MVTDFIERVRAALKRPGITARAVAEKAGLHRNTLCNIDREDWNPSSAVLIALEPCIEAIERGEWPEITVPAEGPSATNSPEIIDPFVKAPEEIPTPVSSGATSPTSSSTSEHPSLPLGNPGCSTSGTAEAA